MPSTQSPGSQTPLSAGSESAPASPVSSSSQSRSLTPKRMNGIPLSLEVEGPGKPGEGKPRRHPSISNNDFIRTFKQGIYTLYDAFKNATDQHPQSKFLGWRPKCDGVAGPYQFMTYAEVKERVEDIASGLASMGLAEKSNIGLYSINRPEWVLSEYACYYNNFVTVPLYDTLGDEALEHICNQTEMRVLIASGDKALNILRLKGKISSLKTIICLDEEISDELSVKAAKSGVELVKLSNVEGRGADSPKEARPPKPEDLCTICYTSGTTGTPKGVMLPHSALVAEAGSIMGLAGVGDFVNKEVDRQFLFRLGPDVVHISYLPLAHVYERVVISVLAAVGATIGFYQGDVLKLMDDIAELRPTLFCTVPRLLNRVYDKIIAGVSNQGSLTRFLFNYAFKSKAYNLNKNGSYEHWLWDRLVFSKIRNRLGGRVEAILSGSAPISPEVMDFLRICFACEVYEGYGQTENAAGASITSRGDWTSGQIGVPIPCNEIKLVDIPEMGYTSNDTPHPRGEICIRGANCFVGYYKEPELTKDALDADGWVHTGDVGEWDELGRLKIIDRKKNIFKLAQGEYISPEKIENIVCRNKYIAQAFVDGNSLKAALVAILVPDFEVLEGWAREKSIDFNDHKDLCSKGQVKSLLMKELVRLGSKGTGELKGFEVPREVFVEHQSFTIDNELLTPSMKLKRHHAKKHYSSTIEKLYSQLSDS